MPGNTKHSNPASSPIEQSDLLDKIGWLIYDIRWVLVPMFAAYWLILAGYTAFFIKEIVEFMFFREHHFNFFSLLEHTSVEWTLFILDMIDMGMVATLFVLSAVGGYNTFVKEYDFSKRGGKPRWMNGLDSSTLKIKMGMSLIGVSGIHLVKTFMELATLGKESGITSERVYLEVLIHLVFVVTTLGYCVIANMLHAHHPAPSQTNATTSLHPDQTVTEHH